MGEMRKTRKLMYLKLPCVGGSNLPSVKSILSESLSLQMGYALDVTLFFQSFFGSKLLCGLTAGAGSAVPRYLPCFCQSCVPAARVPAGKHPAKPLLWECREAGSP